MSTKLLILALILICGHVIGPKLRKNKEKEKEKQSSKWAQLCFLPISMAKSVLGNKTDAPSKKVTNLPEANGQQKMINLPQNLVSNQKSDPGNALQQPSGPPSKMAPPERKPPPVPPLYPPPPVPPSYPPPPLPTETVNDSLLKTPPSRDPPPPPADRNPPTPPSDSVNGNTLISKTVTSTGPQSSSQQPLPNSLSSLSKSPNENTKSVTNMSGFDKANPENSYFVQELEKVRADWSDQNAAKLNRDDFEISNDESATLGIGSYGIVKIGYANPKSTEKFAVKIITKDLREITKKSTPNADSEIDPIDEVRVLVEITRESAKLTSQKTKFTIQLRAFFMADFLGENKLHIVTDYIPGGTLEDFIDWRIKKQEARKETTYILEDGDVRELISELLVIVDFLHRNLSIAYRDLKPENILLDEKGHLVVTDFGIAQIVDYGHRITLISCGTPLYAAPEILNVDSHDFSVDMWSLGIILFKLITGKNPFNWNAGKESAESHDVVTAIKQKQMNVDPPMWTKIRKDLPEAMTLFDGVIVWPDQIGQVDQTGKERNRLTAEEAIELKWFQNSEKYPNPIDWQEYRDRTNTPPFSPVIKSGKVVNYKPRPRPKSSKAVDSLAKKSPI